MISREEIRHLAQLARLKLTPVEEESLQKDISNILDYVGQVSAVSSQGDALAAGLSKASPLKNVMREDVLYEDSLISGKRDALLAALPRREGDYAVVRKVIEKDAE